MKSTKMSMIESTPKDDWIRISKLYCHWVMSTWKIPKRYFALSIYGSKRTLSSMKLHNRTFVPIILDLYWFFLFCRYFKAALRASLGRLDQCYHRGRPIAYGSRALLNWRHSGVLDKHTALVSLVISFHEIDKKSSIDFFKIIIAKLLG